MKKIFLLTLAAFSFICFHSADSSAESYIWKWTDENGTTHYTDNFIKIPEEFQEKAHRTSIVSHPSSKKNTPSKRSSSNSTRKSTSKKTIEVPDGEKIDPKTIETLKGLIEQLKGEVVRDQEIQRWHANKIAYFKLVSSLKGSLDSKNRLLEGLNAATHPKITGEIEWLSNNAALESSLLNSKLAGHYSAKTSHRFRAAVKDILGALPGKQKAMENMMTKLKWLKTNYALQQTQQ